MHKMRILLAALVCAIGILLSGPAGAYTAYWIGAEDLDFDGGIGNITWADATSSHFDAAYARSAILVNPTTTSLNSDYISAQNRFSTTSFWFHTRLYAGPAVGGQSLFSGQYQDLIVFTDVNGLPRLAVSCRGDSSNVFCTPGNSSGATWVISLIDSNGAHTTLVTLTNGPPMATTTTYDIHVSNYGGSGTITVYLGGVAIGGYTGNLATNGNTTLNGVRLGTWDISYSGHYSAWSEVYVSDSITTNLRIATLAPNGTGNSNAWSCSGASPAATVNANPNTDAFNCNSATTGQKQQFTLPTVPAGASGILAVVNSFRGAVGISGPQTFRSLLRVGGSDYESSDIPGAVGLAAHQSVNVTNPATSGPWTVGVVNALQIGVESRP